MLLRARTICAPVKRAQKTPAPTRRRIRASIIRSFAESVTTAMEEIASKTRPAFPPAISSVDRIRRRTVRFPTAVSFTAPTSRARAACTRATALEPIRSALRSNLIFIPIPRARAKTLKSLASVQMEQTTERTTFLSSARFVPTPRAEADCLSTSLIQSTVVLLSTLKAGRSEESWIFAQRRLPSLQALDL